MTEYRVTGEIHANGNSTTVHTEWFDEPKGVVEGVMLGMKMRGWENVEIEERQ